MKRVLVQAILVCAFPAALSAQPAPPPSDVRPPPPCRDAREVHDSANYTPGIDVHGRPVAPADAAGGIDAEISTEVFAQVRTPNRQLGNAGVDVRLKGLETLPPCPSSPPPAKPR